MRKGFLNSRAGSIVDAGTDAADDVSAPDGVGIFRFRGTTPLEEEAAADNDLVFEIEDELPVEDVLLFMPCDQEVLDLAWSNW